MKTRTIIPACLLAAMLTGSGCSCPCCPKETDCPKTTCPEAKDLTALEAAAVDIPGMKKTRKVGDLLFGSKPTPQSLEKLAADGYKTVLSTCGAKEIAWDEKAKAESLGMKFVTIPMAYPIAEIQDAWADRFSELMEKGESPMVLHCASGNRVAGLWTVWLVEQKKLPKEEALRLGTLAGMTKIRPLVEARLKR